VVPARAAVVAALAAAVAVVAVVLSKDSSPSATHARCERMPYLPRRQGGKDLLHSINLGGLVCEYI
jgi:hypothetical protein